MRTPTIKHTEFTQKVILTVRQIPRGRIATYGQIAQLVGRPAAVRGVVWVLHACGKALDLPWHRVINSKGRIAFDRRATNYRLQKALLRTEGVVFDAEERIDLHRFQWRRRAKTQRPAKNQPRMFG